MNFCHWKYILSTIVLNYLHIGLAMELQVYIVYEEINSFVYEDVTCTHKTFYRWSESDWNFNCRKEHTQGIVHTTDVGDEEMVRRNKRARREFTGFLYILFKISSH